MIHLSTVVWGCLFQTEKHLRGVCSRHRNTYYSDYDTPVNSCMWMTVPDTEKMGAQWLSGRVLDSRPKGRGFEPHRRHCVVVLEQDTFILAKYWFNPGRPVPHN